MKRLKYHEFIKQKEKSHIDSGFEIDLSLINKNLFDFQKYIVAKALKAGRYAIFADTGLGKTLMQLEWARNVANKTNKPVLILAPLAVTEQTINESIKFEIYCEKFDVTNDNKDLKGIFIINYEQLSNVDCSQFAGIVLDESSILKSYDGKTKHQ